MQMKITSMVEILEHGEERAVEGEMLHLWFLLLLLLLSPQLIMIESKIDLLIAMGEEEINAP